MAAAVYVFTVILWVTFFFGWSACGHRFIVNPKLGTFKEEMNRMVGLFALAHAILVIIVMVITLTGSITIARKGWAHRFILATDIMFRNPAFTHIFTSLAVVIPDIAKYREDPRETVMIMCLLTFSSCLVFLFRSAAQGGAGTAKVISSSSLAHFVSSLTAPKFPVEGVAKVMNLVVLMVTFAIGVAYLFFYPESPLVRLQVEGEMEAHQRQEEVGEGERNLLINQQGRGGSVEMGSMASRMR